MFLTRAGQTVAQKGVRILLCVAALVLLFGFYTWGISQNPRGFHLDESATAYNAYLVSRTGAGEFGPRLPLLFQQFAVSNATYMNPLAIYLLAVVFRFVPPSIPVARTFAAFWMFAACLLLGVLAKRISGQRKIGIVVAGSALMTPWFSNSADWSSTRICLFSRLSCSCLPPTGFNPKKRGTGETSRWPAAVSR